MRAAFNLFDKDGNGTIEGKEIASILGYNVNVGDEDHIWEDIVKEVDGDGDGKIQYVEFVTMFKLLSEK